MHSGSVPLNRKPLSCLYHVSSRTSVVSCRVMLCKMCLEFERENEHSHIFCCLSKGEHLVLEYTVGKGKTSVFANSARTDLGE